MEALLILLGLAVPLGLFIGWCLGVSAWRQVRALQQEVRALRRVLAEAGIGPAPGAAPAEAQPGGWPPRAPEQAGQWPPRAPDQPGPWPPHAPEQAGSWPPRLSAQPEAGPAPPPEPVPAANPWAAPPPPPPPGATPDPEPVAATPPGPRPDLEAALTQRWGLWLGAGALLLAGVFLVRTAVEEGWLGPAARCGLGAVLGLVLILAAEWLRRRPAPERPGLPWPDYAPSALGAGGVAVLFGAAYGAAVLYALVPPLIGFALLGLVALAGIALALLQGPLVAAVGIAGAYATPLLVQSSTPFLPGLFGYLFIVTAAALAVLRQVAAPWLGWAASGAAAAWVVLGGIIAPTAADLWAPALFVPAVAALHLALLPGAALEGAVGRRLAWVAFGLLAFVGLLLVPFTRDALAGPVAILLLTPVAVWKGLREPRLDRLPWLAALAGLVLLLLWPLRAWTNPGEAVTVDGTVLAILPGLTGWPDAALRPFLGGALVLAGLHAAAGLWGERRAANPVRWAALTAAMPLLVLVAAYVRVRGFALDVRWALAAVLLAGGLVAATTLAMKEGGLQRAGAHAAGAVGALALACAMVLTNQWLTLAVALFLPALAWIAARTDLDALRKVALVVAGVVLVRLLLNRFVLDYDFAGPPVLNTLLLAYGVPVLCFALAAILFRRRGDDATVAVLEAGSLAFLTALVLLLVRQAMTGGSLVAYPGGGGFWSFREAAFQCLSLALLAAAVRRLNGRLGGRPVFAVAWRIQQVVSMLLGALLLVAMNPAFDPGSRVIGWPVFNEMLLAFALPALLAADAARSRDSDWPEHFRGLLAGYAFAMLFGWVTLEVRHLFQPEAMLLDRAAPAGAELYAYSLAWLALGALLLALGVRRQAKAVRLAALGLIALTVLKAFLVDMGELGGLWRVLSFLGLGLALIGLGWVYRRFVATGPAATPPPTPRAPAPPG